jgi:hypothetical protein
MEVVFGGVITLGFEKLIEALQPDLLESPQKIVRHMFIAACFFAFVIYDVCVYLVLIRLFPYGATLASATRYLMDLVMAFCLLAVLLLGLSAEPERTAMATLVCLTFWHVAAAIWHIAAVWERDSKLPELSVFATHGVFAVSYWAVLLLEAALSGATIRQTVDSRGFTMALALTVLAVSIIRSLQMFSRFKRQV